LFGKNNWVFFCEIKFNFYNIYFRLNYVFEFMINLETNSMTQMDRADPPDYPTELVWPDDLDGPARKPRQAGSTWWSRQAWQPIPPGHACQVHQPGPTRFDLLGPSRSLAHLGHWLGLAPLGRQIDSTHLGCRARLCHRAHPTSLCWWADPTWQGRWTCLGRRAGWAWLGHRVG